MKTRPNPSPPLSPAFPRPAVGPSPRRIGRSNAVDFRRSLFRVDTMMPILGVTAGAGATFFALNRSGAATALAWAGVGFIVLVVVASITIGEPINSKFRRLPEGQMPERAEHYRTLWRRFHAARNLAALAALACLAAAAVA